MVYELVSFDSRTAYDRPAVARELPATIGRGRHPALEILDAVVCYPDRPPRLQRPPGGTLGLRVGEVDHPLEVVLDLAVDAKSSNMWQLYQTRGRPVDEDHMTWEVGRTRVFSITASGGHRVLAMLARTEEDLPRSTAVRVRLEVRPDDLEDGMLILAFDPLVRLPEFARDRALDPSIVGVSLRRTIVRAAEQAPSRPRVVTGGRSADGALARAGFVVVNPARDGGEAGLVLVPQRRTGSTLPGRAGRAWDRRRSTALARSMDTVDLTTVRAVDPDGDPHRLTSELDSGRVRIRFGELDRPLLVALPELPDGSRGERWRIHARRL